MENSTDQHDSGEPQSHVQRLCGFALEREDIKWLVEGLLKDGAVDPNTAEYELQLLKIVSIGWGISYFLQEDPLKDEILEPYWRAVQEFAENLSQTTSLLIGKDIAYFEVIKTRLDTYVQAMTALKGDADPTQAVGPAFARCCGREDDPFAVLAGAKLFANTMAHTRSYLAKAVSEDARTGDGGVQ
ncbi:hypothetical protein [Desulfonatronum thioautotrophicum]|uniref:hypothetical protein n=1 Tax=Desulfonatronum thioautotrophicum TaxID=617001 RepID=UPI0005EBD010|nr:hypothetical protein [Desulfonatronum thioautotrophicum]